jgi:predicted dehydrogenase
VVLFPFNLSFILHFISFSRAFRTASLHNSHSALPLNFLPLNLFNIPHIPKVHKMSSNTAPIRVGIIGLGIPEADFAPGAWAAKAHFPYLQASPAYRITAVSNSSVKSSQASIDHYKLGSDVKAYGNPLDIAADPNVDLIVVSVRVGAHYALTKPALLAGKDVFVEWPLAATLSESEELTTLAKDKGVRNIVGVQARASPLITKLRSILKNNEIGTILSSTVNVTFKGFPHDMFIVGADYYMVRTYPPRGGHEKRHLSLCIFSVPLSLEH